MTKPSNTRPGNDAGAGAPPVIVLRIAGHDEHVEWVNRRLDRHEKGRHRRG